MLAAALPFVASQGVPRWALLLARKDVKDDPAVKAQDGQTVDALSGAAALISAEPGSPSFLQASREFQVRHSKALALSGVLAWAELVPALDCPCRNSQGTRRQSFSIVK